MTASRELELAAGALRAWIEGAKTVALEIRGERIELDVSGVRRLAEALVGMADAIDAQGAGEPA